MVRITGIPPEIIIKFAELGANLPEHFDNESERRTFLRNFSLVHSTWKYAGQSELWRRILFVCPCQDRDRRVEHFAESEATKTGLLVTPRLWMVMHSSEDIGKMLDACIGIERLIIAGFRMHIKVALFEKESLASK